MQIITSADFLLLSGLVILGKMTFEVYLEKQQSHNAITVTNKTLNYATFIFPRNKTSGQTIIALFGQLRLLFAALCTIVKSNVIFAITMNKGLSINQIMYMMAGHATRNKTRLGAARSEALCSLFTGETLRSV